MSDLTDRFERLANRGAMRGGDAVLAAARRAADGSGVVRGVDATDAIELDGAVEPIDLQPSSARRHRRFGTAVAASGVAASLFVGALVIGAVVGSGSGSDSPAGAVKQLSDAVSHGDPIAAAAVLAPEEIRSLGNTVTATERRAHTLALAKRADAPLQGIDFSVHGLDLSTETLGPDFAKVTVVGGTFSARTDKGQLSPLMQDVLRNAPDDGSTQAELATLARSTDLPTFVMTVQQGGHWYVSAAYTALEYIREANHLPAADFGSGRAAAATLGAASPDDAVKQGLTALSKGDWASLIALAPPDEVPVYDYRAALEQFAADTKSDFTVDHVSTSSTIDRDTATVKLTASGRDSDGDPWSIDGACFSPPVPADERGDTGSRNICDARGLSIVPLTTNVSGNRDSATFTAVQEDGRWFVSPVGTVLDLIDHAVSSVSEREIYSLLNVPNRIPPDGALTLGTPVTLTGDLAGDRVYTFAGHAGEHILALATPTDRAKIGEYFTTSRVFTSGGKELDGGFGIVDGQALTLPADDTYTIALSAGTDSTFTLYDAEGAPAAAKNPQAGGPTGVCTSTLGGGETCSAFPVPPIGGSSKSSSATTSTVPSG